MKGCILLFGMPRSGTSWIGKLFDSHPDTLYRHEPDSVNKLSLPLYPGMPDANSYRDELRAFVAGLPELRASKVVGKLPLFPKRYQSAPGLLAYRTGVMFAKAASGFGRPVPVWSRPTGRSNTSVRLVWKSIESLGRLGVCVEVLPEARSIHILRHPCGYVASVLRGDAEAHFGDVGASADHLWILKRLLEVPTAQRHGLRLEELQAMAPEERLAWRWCLSQEKTLADTARCARVLAVRYEDVCVEPMGMTRRMFEFTGLGWDTQTEAFISASTGASGDDYYSVFRDSRRAAESWQSDLSAATIDRIMAVVRNSGLAHLYGGNPAFGAVPEEAA